MDEVLNFLPNLFSLAKNKQTTLWNLSCTGNKNTHKRDQILSQNWVKLEPEIIFTL